MSDVCLVQMPYAAAHYPSIALGLLKSGLLATGIDTAVIHANLMWAEELGFDLYLAIEETDQYALLGEWTFSEAAFPRGATSGDAYLRFARRALQSVLWPAFAAVHPGLDAAELVGAMRGRAARFVDRLADEILGRHPRIVGCSSMFQQHCASLALLRRIRDRAPDVVTVLGGANCEGEMGRATHEAFAWIDFVFSGDADVSFPALCSSILNQGRDIAAARLPAAVLGPRSGRSVDASRAAPGAMLSRLDLARVPDYGDYFDALKGSALARFVTPGLPIETSRGCWWGERVQCSFCGLNGERLGYRSKSAPRVLSELEDLSRRHAVTRFTVVDNVLDMRFFRDVLPALSEAGAPFQLFYEVRPHLRRGHLERLAQAGARWLQPGIESLHDEVLKLLRKGTTALQHVAFLKWSRQLGIRLAWAILCGAPGERDEWYAETAAWLPWITHLQPPKGAPAIRFDRFSPYHDAAAAYSLDLHPLPAYSYIYPLSDDKLRDLVPFFVHRPRRSGEGVDPWMASSARPGLSALKDAVQSWTAAFWCVPERERPALTATRRGPDLVIEDSRSAAPEPRVVLCGLESSVYEECEAPKTHAELARLLWQRDGTPESHLDAVLASLAERKLLLSLGGRHLALALRPPVRPLPKEEDAAEGYISAARVITGLARTSLARAFSLTPFELPMSEAFRGDSRAKATPAR